MVGRRSLRAQDDGRLQQLLGCKRCVLGEAVMHALIMLGSAGRLAHTQVSKPFARHYSPAETSASTYMSVLSERS